jgi:copper homeostasis protein
MLANAGAEATKHGKTPPALFRYLFNWSNEPGFAHATGKHVSLPMKVPLFELCVTNLEAARAAESGGADRIELCSQLSNGGVTPDLDLMTVAIEALSIPAYVLIRPRIGDFVFSPAEFDEMKRQIEQAKASGAAGVAIGVLLPNGRVDVERTRELVALAKPMKVTFHRAFDETPDIAEALEDVIRCGVDCLLTSGGEPDVLTGAESIARLCKLARGRLDVMAGGGLQLTSLVEVLRRTGVSHLHGSLARRLVAHSEAGPKRKLQSSRSVSVVSEGDVREAVQLLHREFAAREFPKQAAQ